MFKDQIKAGAALLDEVRPSWDSMQNLERLDIGDASCCIIGQAFPEMPYFLALMRLFPGNEIQGARDHGFAVDCYGMTYEQRDQIYAEYTGEWKQLIQERRKVASLCLVTI